MDINGIKCHMTQKQQDEMYITKLSALGEDITGLGDTPEESREMAVEGMEHIINGHKIIDRDGTNFLMKYMEKDSDYFDLYHHVIAHNGDTGKVGVGEDPDIDYAEYQAIEMSLR